MLMLTTDINVTVSPCFTFMSAAETQQRVKGKKTQQQQQLLLLSDVQNKLNQNRDPNTASETEPEAKP